MIPIWEPLFDGNEDKYLAECLQTGWVSSQGRFIPLFEQTFADWSGLPFGVACSSGTAGLHMAIVALGIGPGDEVIIPDFTLIVSASTVILAGARPVLVDVDDRTFCIDPRHIEERITPRTKAIMAVHMYGHPCDMPAIADIAKRHGLAVIEDCAEALGAEIGGRKVGTFGDAAVFSFYGNKILTTGEGGLVLCKDEALARTLRLLRDQAFQEPRFVHERLGFNYRMTNLQAAIGLAQTERVDHKIAIKRSIAHAYSQRFAGTNGLGLPFEAEGAKNVYWMYGVVLDDTLGAGRNELMRRLADRGIDTRGFFHPMHLQPVFRQGSDPRYPDVSGEFPVSTKLGRQGLYLPSGLTLSESDIDEVAHGLLSCLAAADPRARCA